MQCWGEDNRWYRRQNLGRRDDWYLVVRVGVGVVCAGVGAVCAGVGAVSPGGNIISHWEWMRTNSHSLTRAAKRSVTNVVSPVPGTLQAIHRSEGEPYLLEFVNLLPRLSPRIDSMRRSLPSVSVAGMVWYLTIKWVNKQTYTVSYRDGVYLSAKPAGWLASKKCIGKCGSRTCFRDFSPHRGHHFNKIFEMRLRDVPHIRARSIWSRPVFINILLIKICSNRVREA